LAGKNKLKSINACLTLKKNLGDFFGLVFFRCRPLIGRSGNYLAGTGGRRKFRVIFCFAFHRRLCRIPLIKLVSNELICKYMHLPTGGPVSFTAWCGANVPTVHNPSHYPDSLRKHTKPRRDVPEDK